MEEIALGECGEFTFPFVDKDGNDVDLTLYDEVQIRLEVGGVSLTPITPDTLAMGAAEWHSEVDSFTRIGVYTAEAWARQGIHWTRSRETRKFKVVDGLALPTP